MPDINEGLEIDGQPLVSYDEGDVNTQGGFESALGRAVSGEVESPEEEAPEPSEGEPEPQEGTPDPEDTVDWKARYEEQQKVMGRQGAELGELRRMQEQFAERFAQQPQPAQPLAGPLNIEGLVEERGGADVVNWAIDQAPEYIDEAARLWALSGDPEGAVFYADYRAEQARLDVTSQPQAPADPDPALRQLSTERKLAEVFREARENDPKFGEYEAGIGPALTSEETPDEIKLMLVSGNPDHMREAVNFLKPYARLEAIKAGEAPAEPAPALAQDTQAEQTRREAIRRTAIVTGSQRLQAVEGQPESDGELTSEERIKRFKDQFDEVPSTDIQSGLTINGQPVIPQRPARAS